MSHKLEEVEYHLGDPHLSEEARRQLEKEREELRRPRQEPILDTPEDHTLDW